MEQIFSWVLERSLGISVVLLVVMLLQPFLHRRYRPQLNCLVWTALYLSFTPVGADVIRGVQGRYYLPVTMMGLLAVRTIALRNCLPRRIDLTVVTALSVFLLLCAMYTGVICNTF